MKQKMQEWVRRYLPAEIVSLALTMISAELTFRVSANPLLTAWVATFVGNLAYFGYILIADVIDTMRGCRLAGKKYGAVVFLKNIRALFVEFGFAEVIDSFIVRPTLMYYFPILLNNLSLGTLAAKIAADVTFYIPAIVSYELSKKKLRKFH